MLHSHPPESALSALVTCELLTPAGDLATADRRVMENVGVVFELNLQDSILPPRSGA